MSTTADLPNGDGDAIPIETGIVFALITGIAIGELSVPGMKERTSEKIRVLIVEDEASAREASRRYLEFMGYVVETAASASEAESTATDFRPQVVVCDWRLAGTRDGIDVARFMKSSYDARIILVTAYPLDELKDRTDGMGVNRYLRKPISLTALADTIDDITPA